MTIGSIFRPLLEHCRETHTDVSAILREEGLTEEKLVDPETRLPTERSRALGKRLFAALKDPEVGLRVAERFRPEDADLVFISPGRRRTRSKRSRPCRSTHGSSETPPPAP